MPIEIKELLIRAFVDEQKQDDNDTYEEPDNAQTNAQDSLAMVANMLKQEKER